MKSSNTKSGLVLNQITFTKWKDLSAHVFDTRGRNVEAGRY